MSSWFAASGGSPPPRFRHSPLSYARIGVPSERISSAFQSGDRILQQIRSFNFKSVPNSERCRGGCLHHSAAARCICTTVIGSTIQAGERNAGRGEPQCH